MVSYLQGFIILFFVENLNEYFADCYTEVPANAQPLIAVEVPVCLTYRTTSKHFLDLYLVAIAVTTVLVLARTELVFLQSWLVECYVLDLG